MIISFFGSHRFLSNFWIESDGSSIEVKYQQAKCANEEDKLKFKGLLPREAKKLGRKIKLRSDWDHIKVSIMESLVRDKFNNSSTLRIKLLETGDNELVELNSWGDTFWGVCNGKGENNLGKILMKIRAEIKQ